MPVSSPLSRGCVSWRPWRTVALPLLLQRELHGVVDEPAVVRVRDRVVDERACARRPQLALEPFSSGTASDAPSTPSTANGAYDLRLMLMGMPMSTPAMQHWRRQRQHTLVQCSKSDTQSHDVYGTRIWRLIMQDVSIFLSSAESSPPCGVVRSSPAGWNSILTGLRSCSLARLLAINCRTLLQDTPKSCGSRKYSAVFVYEMWRCSTNKFA